MTRAILLTLLSAAGLPGAEPIPPPRWVAQPVRPRLALSVPKTLRYGQPLDVTLTCTQAVEGPPYVRFNYAEPPQTVFFELTIETGEAVPAAVEFLAGSDTALVRLQPSGLRARGIRLAPGRYRLRAFVDAKKDPFDPEAWAGRVEAPGVAFTVAGDDRPLSADAARRLVADLQSPKHATRLAALRRAPPTENAAVLAALVELLADPHEGLPSFGPGIFDVGLVHTIALEARETLPAQGAAAVAPLLAFAARPENAKHRGAVADVLGRLGPDPRSLAFLRGVLAGRNHDDCLSAVEALGRLGPGAVPDLIAVARDGGHNAIVRRVAIEQSARHGTAETVGPFLREVLAGGGWQNVWSAARAMEAVEYRGAMPELRRLAEDGKQEQNTRAAALHAYAVLSERAEARAFLRQLLNDPSVSVRGDAVRLLGAVGDSSDVPRVIEMLGDPEWYPSALADKALRGLLDRPAGVAVDRSAIGSAAQWRAVQASRGR